MVLIKLISCETEPTNRANPQLRCGSSVEEFCCAKRRYIPSEVDEWQQWSPTVEEPRYHSPQTCWKKTPSVSRAKPFPQSSNRKRVLKPGNAASGPPETEIDCFSHATSPEIDKMARPLYRKWKHSTRKWTSCHRLRITKKDLVC